MTIIGIINLGTNNINCFLKIITKNNKRYKIINEYEDYDTTIDKLIIPGIGNYFSCIHYLINHKLDRVIIDHYNKHKKLLGICIGMQLFSSTGSEGGLSNGLDIIPGSATKILPVNELLPNIGWNTLQVIKDCILFQQVDLTSDFYFVHSYYLDLKNNENIVSTSNYGGFEFTAVVQIKNAIGIQFHPEKSGKNGVKIIENFLSW